MKGKLIAIVLGAWISCGFSGCFREYTAPKYTYSGQLGSDRIQSEFYKDNLGSEIAGTLNIEKADGTITYFKYEPTFKDNEMVSFKINRIDTYKGNKSISYCPPETKEPGFCDEPEIPFGLHHLFDKTITDIRIQQRNDMKTLEALTNR